ncbi:MAG: 4-alpha-glucanotransferase [Thermodesulfovibrionales bacterium]|nr:4-alpha-glucanotransferase [Thermodesulfovibrionales bacterium]
MTDLRPELIDALSELSGIIPEYYDIWGKRHASSLETKAAILRAMGVEISESGLDEMRSRPWGRFIRPVTVVSVNSPSVVIPLYFQLEEGREKEVSVTWSLEDEEGGMKQGSLKGVSPSDTNLISGLRYVRADISLEGQWDIGYYRLDVRCKTPHAEHSGRMRLIIAPDACYVPPGGFRTWGVTVNLYAVRSKNNWGIGDLTDLSTLVKGIAGMGGGFAGINPLHAIPNKRPYGISPYSPISRLYGNFIYIDIEGVPEFKETAMSRSKKLARELAAIRKGSLVDYEAVASVKEKALSACFSAFYKNHYETGTQRGLEFKEYITEEGSPLESFALFMAIAKKHSGTYDFRQWPKGFRSPLSPDTLKFKQRHWEEVLYYMYVQWLIDNGLREASGIASEEGMAVGIYQDLAVGTIKGGSEAWTFPGAFAPDAGVGAPPDAFNPNGQDWGVMAPIPEKLMEAGYEPLIQTIRKNLSRSRALRIDHALGLFRLFWIPEGMKPQDGAYVAYPHEDILRIIALESVRQRAIIVAEDLGTITDEAREALRRFRMLSYRLFYFERNWPQRDFIAPGDYPELSLSAVTTHDLPTLYGYWAGRDIELKDALGLYSGEGFRQRDAEERNADRALMLDALSGFLPEGFPRDVESVPEMTPEMCLAVYGFLAATPSALVAVSLDDMLGVMEQPNMPGTVDAPNWSRRLPLEVNEILNDDRLSSLAAMFKESSLFPSS